MRIFKFLLLYFLTFTAIANNAQKIETKTYGYDIIADVNGDMHQEQIIESAEYTSATFRAFLEEYKKYKEFPPGVHFRFSDQKEEFVLVFGLTKQPEQTDKVIMGTELWVSGNKVIDEKQAVEEFKRLSDIILEVDWAGQSVKFSINEKLKFELPFPPQVKRLTFGIQSAKGKIKVSLPKK